MFSFRNLRRAALAAICASPGIVFAEGASQPISNLLQVGFVDDTGAAIRIEAGDALRTISQEVPAAVCHLHNGVSADLGAKLLNEGLQNFAFMLNALLNGDPAIGILGGEENVRTKRLMESLQTAWEPMHAAAVQVQQDPSDTAAVEVVYSLASDMLDKTSFLLSELEGEYTNPVELLYSDAMLLEVSGRQSMLTQRLSYLACRKWSGSADDEYIELMKTTTSQYVFAMEAMQSGAPELGISPPPTAEIAEELALVAEDGDMVIGHLNDLIETGTLAPDAAASLYEMLAEKLYKMDHIAHLYAVYSKRVY